MNGPLSRGWRVFGKRSALAALLGMAIAIPVYALQRSPSQFQPQPPKTEPLAKVCANPNRPPPKSIDPTAAIAKVGSPDYDPIAMLKEKLAYGHQIFEREFRDDAWATSMETEMRSRLKAALGAVPGRRVEAVECRLSSCRIAISARAEDATPATLSIQQPMLGNGFALDMSQEAEGRFTQQGFYFFSPDQRNLDAYRRALVIRSARYKRLQRAQ
jgi:hypothetical protein